MQSKWGCIAHAADSAGRAQGDVASPESSISPLTGEKCLRSRPRREEAKGAICRAHEVGKEKARTAFQSPYNKIKGQPTAVWASAQGNLVPLQRDAAGLTKGQGPYKSHQTAGLRQELAPRSMHGNPGSRRCRQWRSETRSPGTSRPARANLPPKGP